MRTEPQTSFKCGPYAVNNLLAKGAQALHSEVIADAKSTKEGTNLSQVQKLADKVGLKMQMARRTLGAPLIVPSIMHSALDHFVAIASRDKDGTIVIKDPTFGADNTMGAREETLDQESDGYFLIPAGPLPAGWTRVSLSEGQKVWGKGAPGGPYGNAMNPPAHNMPPCETHIGVGGNACGRCGMAQASMWTMNTCLNIKDTPLEYSPPLGDPIQFRVNYNQEETNQPGSFTFTNLGPNWTFVYCSYLTVGVGSVLTVRLPGGGSQVATLSGGVYPADQLTQAVMVNTGTAYERHMPDGSMQLYDQADTNGNWFMTKMIDAQNNQISIQYDVNFRITTITDAIGQVSTLSYVSNTVGNSGFYKIASITDPFSRSCSFAYDSTNTNLLSITDVISLTSKLSTIPVRVSSPP